MVLVSSEKRRADCLRGTLGGAGAAEGESGLRSVDDEVGFASEDEFCDGPSPILFRERHFQVVIRLGSLQLYRGSFIRLAQHAAVLLRVPTQQAGARAVASQRGGRLR